MCLTSNMVGRAGVCVPHRVAQLQVQSSSWTPQSSLKKQFHTVFNVLKRQRCSKQLNQEPVCVCFFRLCEPPRSRSFKDMGNTSVTGCYQIVHTWHLKILVIKILYKYQFCCRSGSCCRFLLLSMFVFFFFAISWGLSLNLFLSPRARWRSGHFNKGVFLLTHAYSLPLAPSPFLVFFLLPFPYFPVYFLCDCGL